MDPVSSESEPGRESAALPRRDSGTQRAAGRRDAGAERAVSTDAPDGAAPFPARISGVQRKLKSLHAAAIGGAHDRATPGMAREEHAALGATRGTKGRLGTPAAIRDGTIWRGGWRPRQVRPEKTGRRCRAVFGRGPGISVVIPSRDGRSLLAAQLPGIVAEAPEQIIVVDNGSIRQQGDDTEAGCAPNYPADRE